MANFWQKFFSDRNTTTDSLESPILKETTLVAAATLDTVPLTPLTEEKNSNLSLSEVISSPEFKVAQKTDLGHQRQNNQDSLYTATAYIHTNQGLELFGLFIVADGAGGHQGGELASALAIRTAAGHVLKNLYLPDLSSKPSLASQIPLNQVLQEAVTAANQQVVEQLPGSASTFTMAVMMGRCIYLAHVGDSRAYIYHEGSLRKVTKDHSMVARLVEIGQITEEEAKEHPMRNSLYLAIGQPNKFEVASYIQSFPDKGILLLCSDGLWGTVPEPQMIDILASSTTLDEAADHLIDAANDQGGDDNITVVLVCLEDID